MCKRIHGEHSNYLDIVGSLDEGNEISIYMVKIVIVLLLNRSHIHKAMDEYNKAEEYLMLLLSMYKRIHGEDSNHPDIARTLRSLDDNFQALICQNRFGCSIS